MASARTRTCGLAVIGLFTSWVILQGPFLTHARYSNEDGSRSGSVGVRGDLHFPLQARGTNLDGSLPIYKDPNAPIEDRIDDLLPRMTLQEKVAQLCVLLVRGQITLTMRAESKET